MVVVVVVELGVVAVGVELGDVVDGGFKVLLFAVCCLLFFLIGVPCCCC